MVLADFVGEVGAVRVGVLRGALVLFGDMAGEGTSVLHVDVDVVFVELVTAADGVVGVVDVVVVVEEGEEVVVFEFFL